MMRNSGTSRRIGLALCTASLLTVATVVHATPAASCDQVAADYNYVIGTQAFGSDPTSLKGPAVLKHAQTIRALGSNLLKISLGKRQAAKYGLGDVAQNSRSELGFLKSAPGLQKALDLDFKYYQFWVQGFSKSEWRDGVSAEEAKIYYRDIYDLTEWLLNRYSGTGKTFMLGNWEGDWLLNGGQGKAATPTQQAIDGMIDWLNIRQKAVDDAKAATSHSGVEVYHYVEVNLVKRAIEGQPSVASSVLPATNVDLVSYSSYEAIKQSKVPDIAAIREPMTGIVRYLQQQLRPKPNLPFANRVFIGEYGYHANAGKPLTVEQQFMKSRYVMQVAIELDMPFALIWQLYNNEYEPDGSSAEMGLIADSGQKRALYFLHQQFLTSLRGFVAESCRSTGQPPTRPEFRERALAVLQSLSFEKMEQLAQAQ